MIGERRYNEVQVYFAKYCLFAQVYPKNIFEWESIIQAEANKAAAVRGLHCVLHPAVLDYAPVASTNRVQFSNFWGET
jgi:hypothetical protein